jgi:hypothetical protein
MASQADYPAETMQIACASAQCAGAETEHARIGRGKWWRCAVCGARAAVAPRGWDSLEQWTDLILKGSKNEHS